MEKVCAAKDVKILEGAKNSGYEADIYIGEKKVGHASKLPDGGSFMLDVYEKETFLSLLSAMPREIRSNKHPFEPFVNALVDESISSAMRLSDEEIREAWEAQDAYHD